MNTNEYKKFRPQFALYHTNAKGTGCAIKMGLVPADVDDDGHSVDGYIRMRLANQMTIGNPRGPNPTYPRFDWENVIEVDLNFDDLCKILQVFRGECENINDGKGLFHSDSTGRYRVTMSHHIDPVHGYSLEVSHTDSHGNEDSRSRFFFTPAESCGICEAIAGVMGTIVFGDPIIIPHK